MKNNPTISIIVPVYNVEEYLPFCLKSIQNQTFTDFECILIDDGSTDNSGNICDNIANTDDRFMVVHQDNQGYQTARNSGLANAIGVYISFVDADDSIHPQMLEILYLSLTKEPSCSFSMVYGKPVYSHTIKTQQIINPTTKIIYQSEMIKKLFGGSDVELQFQVVWNKLYKKETLWNIHFQHTGTEDTLFNCNVYLNSKSGIIINEQLYYWFQRNTSITHQKIDSRYIDRMNSYYLALNNMQNKDYRAYCLIKIYKIMLSTRYHSRLTNYKKEANRQVSELKRKTFVEFLHNKRIDFWHKTGLLFFLYLPFTYTIFMKFMEYKANANPQITTH